MTSGRPALLVPFISFSANATSEQRFPWITLKGCFSSPILSTASELFSNDTRASVAVSSRHRPSMPKVTCSRCPKVTRASFVVIIAPVHACKGEVSHRWYHEATRGFPLLHPPFPSSPHPTTPCISYNVCVTSSPNPGRSSSLSMSCANELRVRTVPRDAYTRRQQPNTSEESSGAVALAVASSSSIRESVAPLDTSSPGNMGCLRSDREVRTADSSFSPELDITHVIIFWVLRWSLCQGVRR
jgi:hypothetical protein